MTSSPLTANAQGTKASLKSRVEETADKPMQLSEQAFGKNNYAAKLRKPYTITKERERWTDKEHKKFVEALKLYGRAWRRIEEHVGTKTAVQIRSHAQKFFSKVARETTGGNESSVEPIVIPPPRPKKKPAHPYPRKFGNEADRTSRSISPSEQANQSPTSVLSTVESEALGSIDSNSPNRSLSPVSSASPPAGLTNAVNAHEEREILRLELFPREIFLTNRESSPQSLKLFGKTVLVSDSGMSSSLTTSTYSKFPIQPLPGKHSPSKTLPIILNPQEEISSCSIQAPPKQEDGENKCSDLGKVVQNEGSSTGSNSGSVDDTGHTDKNSEPQIMVCKWEFRPSVRSAFSELRKTNSESNSRGFSPYKKRKMVIEEEQEHEEEQGIHLYL